MKEIRNRFYKKEYGIAIILAIIFVFLSIAFILYSGYLSKLETKKYISDTTNQAVNTIENAIEEKFGTLSAAAVYLDGKDFMNDEQYLMITDEALKENNSFVAVGFADLIGRCYWVGADDQIHRGHIRQEDHTEFYRAFSGKNALTGTIPAIPTAIPVNAYIVPIHSDGVVVGALFAADHEDILRKVAENTVYAGQGFIHIIKTNGDYVVRSNNPLRIENAEGIYDVKPPLTPGITRSILDNMARGKAGSFESSVYDHNRLIAYAPLNINNWYIFYVAVEDQVNAGLKNVITTAICAILLGIVLFFILVYLIHRSNKSNQIELEKLAYVDDLTGQRNLSKFIIDAETILKSSQNRSYSIWVGDIRRFKYVNDLFGRQTGDKLIKYFSDYLVEKLKNNEIMGRAGADIFALFKQYTGSEAWDIYFDEAQKHLNKFSQKYLMGYKILLCCGIYICHPCSESASVESMVGGANDARKALKKSGSESGFAFYTDAMREETLWKLEVEAEMEEALQNGEFKLYLQPKIDIQKQNAIMGMEALVRWDSHYKGIISPSRFIPLFEKNGFIVALDKYIFNEACRYYKENVLDCEWEHLVLSVNVSRISIMHPSFIKDYTDIKKKYDIPDGCLELEFTESIATDNIDQFGAIVSALHENGFLCSLDDFGAGYSSLNALMNLNVDVLKLDGKFFQFAADNIRREKLVRSIVAMAKELHIKTVAEGIDEDSQVTLLRDMGCEAIQGYYFSKPVSAEDFNAFIRNWPHPETI